MTAAERQARRLASVLRPGAELTAQRTPEGWRVVVQTTHCGECIAYTSYPPRPTEAAAWEPAEADLLDDAGRLLRRLHDAMDDAVEAL